MLSTPLIYVGPTLPRSEVEALLPGCIVRPPIARGDLYRDRMLRGSVFVILDGVFLQDRAVSPREILDVSADGALVIGAASMGALRAAECWPGGVRGIGSIYRLFRAGCLDSDDEVAVSFDAERPNHSSVALVNVRYATWRAVRQGRLEAQQAERLVSTAKSIFYSQRHWRTIIDQAKLNDLSRAVVSELATADLKRMDALRALARLKRWSANDAQFFQRPTTGSVAFTLSDATRERPYDVLDGAPPASALRELARWLLVSGRYTRYSGALAGLERRSRKANASPAVAELEAELLAPKLAGRVTRNRRRRQRFPAEFWGSEAESCQQILVAVTLEHELESELFRFRAVQRLAAQAELLRLVPSLLDRHDAEQSLAFEHGYESWAELCESSLLDGVTRTHVENYRTQLALAHATRRALSPSQVK